MQKLQEIRFNHFKYFYGDYSIKVNRKNMLLYGENGSGKSSIYWGLYTFLQSALKDEQDVKDYFNHEIKGNLVNRFAGSTEHSSIELSFRNSQSVPQERTISKTIVNTKAAGDTFVSELLSSSDFINYKLLSRTYDFRNSEPADLFDLFETEVLKFMQFREDFIRHDGVPGNNNASDWWDYIKDGINPRPKMHEQAYKTFVIAVRKFNFQFKFYLRDITERANVYLREKFKQNYKLSLEYVDATYDRFKEGSTTVRTHETTKPKILLTAEYNNGLLDRDNRGIERPQSFLNEAKLTTIALSIRFAILDKKVSGLVVPKLLVLDDLLISLDMSNRDKVLDIILDEFTDTQLLIFTHDRSFFNLTKRRIENDYDADAWIFKEMYQDKDLDTNIPKPFILDTESYLSLANKYLKEFDYPACGNYLRKECERILLQLLPENLTVKQGLDDGKQLKQLDDLIQSFKKWYEELGFDFTPFSKLKEYKDLLLNPLSHDNISSPIYRIELENIRSILLKLNKITKIILIDINSSHFTITLNEEDTSENQWQYSIELRENLYAIKDLDGTWHLNNPSGMVNFGNNITTGAPATINSQILKLKKIYDQIRHGIGNKIFRGGAATDIIPAKDLKDVISINGVPARSILT